MSHNAPPLIVASAMPGIVWPALPGASGAALLAVLFQLDQSQWWPSERLEAAQRQQLAMLLDHARVHVPFWRDRIPADWPDPVADPQGWEAAWRALPILGREEIQATDAGETMLADALLPGHGEWREVFTSGSTGQPIRSVRSQIWELLWSAFTVRDHLWHRRDLTGTLAVIRESGAGKAAYPDGDIAEGWGFSSASLFRTGRLVSLNVSTPPDQQLDWLLRQDPDYLLTHPSILGRLVEESERVGRRPQRLRHGITIAETLRPELRERVATAWGLPVIDVYSTREAGYLALQCPDHPHYHVQSELLRVEVLDEQGLPCAPGTTGRVIVTPLHNLAMPLIRYDIGDAAEVGSPCPCGRGLPVLKRILGRTQNMLRLRSGERRWTLLSSGDLATLQAAAPGLRQYQVVQTALDQMRVVIALARPLQAVEVAAVEAWARAKFGEEFSVTVECVPEMARSQAGKFEDFVCVVPD